MAEFNKEYFTRKEILSDLLDTVSYLIEESENIGVEEYSVDSEQIFEDTFNDCYYIVGTYEAQQALEQYGVFKALEEVTDYEFELSGEFTPNFMRDLLNPEKLASLLYYIKANELFMEWNLHSEDFTNEQLKELEAKIEEELKQ